MAKLEGPRVYRDRFSIFGQFDRVEWWFSNSILAVAHFPVSLTSNVPFAFTWAPWLRVKNTSQKVGAIRSSLGGLDF